MRLTGHKLREKLHYSKLLMRKKEITRQRTVCGDRECIEIKQDGREQQITVYKSHYHPECFLEGVPLEVIGYPELIHYAAFNGSDYCHICRHYWRMYLYIFYQ